MKKIHKLLAAAVCLSMVLMLFSGCAEDSGSINVTMLMYTLTYNGQNGEMSMTVTGSHTPADTEEITSSFYTTIQFKNSENDPDVFRFDSVRTEFDGEFLKEYKYKVTDAKKDSINAEIYERYTDKQITVSGTKVKGLFKSDMDFCTELDDSGVYTLAFGSSLDGTIFVYDYEQDEPKTFSNKNIDQAFFKKVMTLNEEDITE